MYDFDKTLSPRDMQEYSFIPSLQMEAGEFWNKCEEMSKKHQMDSISAYMLAMLQEAEKSNLHLTKEAFNALGKDVQLFDGVESWFQRINDYGNSIGVQVEHYILSSGLEEIVEGTSIAREFKKIYASKFVYNDYDEPIWPAMVVNYTSKTQFIFRINKGVLDVTDNKTLNASMAEEEKRVPFTNMIYIGDGFTDVPCMKIVRHNGGHSIAVYNGDASAAQDMIAHDRVDFVLKSDYRENTEMETTVKAILDLIQAQEVAEDIHNNHIQRIQKKA
ncbi:MAG: haloacid dehalogenase-like hydrolase [Erysipelotrichaceae bacterium]|nr:haloacid dehalogenase-like hydrolase [Erysipelotrichaceae bacterium]